MKKPEIEVVRNAVSEMYKVNGELKGVDDIKEVHEEMIDALIVAKERMNNELEHLDTNDLFVDKEQYESFVGDIEIVNKALKKAGCHD